MTGLELAACAVISLLGHGPPVTLAEAERGGNRESLRREEIIGPHRMLLRSECQNASFHRSSMTLKVCVSIVYPSCPHPATQSSSPVHQARASPRSLGGNGPLTENHKVALLCLHQLETCFPETLCPQ